MIDNSIQLPSDRPSADRRHYIKSSDYPEHCKRVLLDFCDLIEDRKWSQAQAARKIKHGPNKTGISTGTISALLNGSYNADPRAVCSSIERLLNLESGRAAFAEVAFVKTRMFEAVENLADVAVVTRRIAYAHGPVGCGKSVNAQALAHLYQNATPVFLTLPYAGSYGGFIKRLAAIRSVPTNGTLDDVRERILSSLDDTHLLIVDEAHQPNLNYSHSQAVRVFEFLREINDLCRVPILLIGHSEGHHQLVTHSSFEAIAAKLIGKSIAPCIPTRNTALRDLNKILNTYRLPDPSPENVSFCLDLIASSSVGRLFDVLRLASGRAERSGEALTWQHVHGIQDKLLKLN